MGNKRLIQGIFHDVTQRHQYETKLLQAKERAEELLQLKSSLLNNMSHELRTPLTGILGFSEVLTEEAPEGMKEHARTVHSSAERLMKTLNSVLDLAQLESGEAQLEPEVLDVVSEVREVVSLLQPLADGKSLGLEVDVACQKRAYIECDPACLSRTVNNLVGNAIKFTSEGRVSVIIDNTGSKVRISVRDTGVGIKDEFLEHLFDAFRQESTGLSRSHEGTGLGLAITSRLVELMNGTIDVESEKGKGSVFTVTIPRVCAAKNEQSPASLPADDMCAAQQPPERAHDRLLVVEDNAETRSLIQHRLDGRFKVYCASTPAEALRMADEMTYDGFLLDIGLGADRAGIDVLQALREFPEYATTPAVALTAYAMPGDKDRFVAVGFDHYLSKPFTRAQFMEMIDEVFTHAHSAD